MIQSIETGRKEDGNRSIADKIIKRLHDLEKTVLTNHGRWAWELLQNAKDSVAGTDRSVSVKIIFDEDQIEFQHNGDHFTEKDIRGLINQISSKEVEEGQQSKLTGRFGTGFLTTHLLSKLINIKGIVKTADEKYFRFSFPLDRNGKTTQILVPKVENAWVKFHASTDNNQINGYKREEFNTSFIYPLETNEQKQIAQTGVDEFIALIPYVLAFIPKIQSVEIVDRVNWNELVFENTNQLDALFKEIIKTENGKESTIKLILRSNEVVGVAVEVYEEDETYQIRDITNVPKLFCDFPLIGTENFYFPVVVNSFYFNPQTERDGVWLQTGPDEEVLENKSILEQALTLYMALIEEISLKPFINIFNIARTQMPKTDEKYFDVDWYRSGIQEPLRSFLKDQPIVTRENGENSILNEIWFPMKLYSTEVRVGLWQYTRDLFPSNVCRLKDLNSWISITWESLNKISYTELISDLANQTTITELMKQLEKDEPDTFEWYNEVLKFLMADDNNILLFDKYKAIPNKNGNFLLKSELYIDAIEDESLVEVLQLLGEDWNDLLLHDTVGYGTYFDKKKKDIAHKITENLRNISKENSNAIKAISILTEWFDYHAEEGAQLFPDNYRNRAELFLNTIEDKDSLYKLMRSKTNLADLTKVAAVMDSNPKLVENIELTREIYALMEQFNVTNIQQLKDVLLERRQPSELLPVTEEILVNMGITSVEEWKEAIKDKDLSALFSHETTPTTDMFIYVQSLISRAKKAIVSHLESLDNYNLDEMDTSTAPTILAGILKDDVPISIVARPAYNGEVIIYYGSERDILDFEPSELWIDDGVRPHKITLGHLLKKAQIVKFPI